VCECMCGFCNVLACVFVYVVWACEWGRECVCVCVCVVFVMCGCFGSMYTVP